MILLDVDRLKIEPRGMTQSLNKMFNLKNACIDLMIKSKAISYAKPTPQLKDMNRQTEPLLVRRSAQVTLPRVLGWSSRAVCPDHGSYPHEPKTMAIRESVCFMCFYQEDQVSLRLFGPSSINVGPLRLFIFTALRFAIL